ncbi:hypothetical protein MsAg5_17810 [Methanosarcinaceae archaeon Ag5]|uniref:Uncharacterized protein n=1 Tax=Methanolapillus africanus TaxID=3028297 RepID=A0AAE4SEK4_9EURY|nr:hypothetical protein [Methanosarcinaceae archaeon Ag5]
MIRAVALILFIFLLLSPAYALVSDDPAQDSQIISIRGHFGEKYTCLIETHETNIGSIVMMSEPDISSPNITHKNVVQTDYTLLENEMIKSFRSEKRILGYHIENLQQLEYAPSNQTSRDSSTNFGGELTMNIFEKSDVLIQTDSKFQNLMSQLLFGSEILQPRNLSSNFTASIDNGSYGTYQVYVRHSVWTYDLYRGDTKVGSGVIREPVGFSTVLFEWTEESIVNQYADYENADYENGRDLSELDLDFDINAIDWANISEEEAAQISEAIRLAAEREMEKDIERSIAGS